MNMRLPISVLMLVALLGQTGVLAQFDSHDINRRHHGLTSGMAGIDFAAAVPYLSGGYYSVGAATGDLNGDGKPDLLVTNLCAGTGTCSDSIPGSVGVLLANGDGTFQPATAYDSGGHYAFSVAVADVNADGNLDLLIANQCADAQNCDSGGSVGVLLGMATEPFGLRHLMLQAA